MPDFGLAKASADGSSPGLTNWPTVPRGQAVDKRTDIWAFGCVLYEMLTGHVAFPGKTIPDTLAGVFEREPDWALLPATTPPVIHRLLERCLDVERVWFGWLGDGQTNLPRSWMLPAE